MCCIFLIAGCGDAADRPDGEPVVFESGEQFIRQFFTLAAHVEYERISEEMLTPDYAEIYHPEDIREKMDRFTEMYGRADLESLRLTGSRHYTIPADDGETPLMRRSYSMHIRFGSKVIYGEFQFSGISEPELRISDVWLTDQ